MKEYAVRNQGKRLQYYATREAAERAMKRSDYADMWQWDEKNAKWKHLSVRAVFRAMPKAATAIVLAALLGLTATQAQAICWMPRHWGGLEEQLYDQCQEQERLADEVQRQNQILERQESDRRLQRWIDDVRRP